MLSGLNFSQTRALYFWPDAWRLLLMFAWYCLCIIWLRFFFLLEAMLKPEGGSGSMDYISFFYIIFSSLQRSFSFPFDFWLISRFVGLYFHLCFSYCYCLVFICRYFPFSVITFLHTIYIISFRHPFLFSYRQMFP